MKTRTYVTAALLASGCSASASDSSGTGSVQIFVVAEDTIKNGLVPGAEGENIQDGWTIRYDRYLVAVGNFRASRTDTAAMIGEGSTFVLDLKNAPENGYVVAELANVAAARWDKFGYDVPNARPGAKTLPPTKQTDVDFMTQNGFSVYFEGTAEKAPDKISFKWGFATGTSFDDCTTAEGLPGFAVPSGGTVQVKPTLHGDHQYFDNVTQGVELTRRLAQWMKTCDLDANADLTIAELKACTVASAMPTPPYDLTSVKDQDGDGRISVFDVVSAQMRTFGDFQGDGECPTRRSLP